jgi:outer membrane biosynthesis protein TonB
MQPIQINVQVSIGLNSELFTLLSSVVNRPAQVAELPAAPRNKKPAKPQPEPKPEVTNQPTPTDGQATASEEPEPQPEATKPEPEPAPVQEPAPEPQREPEPAQEGAKEYTEVDVRAAMDRTRKRIEGENYKEKTDSEGYKKWHRVLTGWFKNTAAMFGAEKPSALPDSESRAKFIACCDAVQVKGDELIEDCPF